MAKILVSVEVLERALFPNTQVEIHSIEYDCARGIYTMEIDGAGVPKTDWVQAEFRKEYVSVTFKPIENNT